MARITFQDLLTLAKSSDERDRKQAYGLFRAWIKNADKVPDKDRLTAMERFMLEQIFAQRGLKSEQRR